MRHLYRNSILVLLLLLVFGVTIYPPKEQLRLGKDLAGGVSLTYTIFLDPDDPPETVDRMIEVLKQRVNPDGLFEISFVQQGRDRLVVTMPLPSDNVLEARRAYEAALTDLEPFNLNEDAFQAAMRAEGEERRELLRRLIDGSEARAQIIEPVLAAVDEVERTRAAYQTAVDAGPISEDDDTLDELEAAAARAQIALDEARSAALQQPVAPREVRQALELSDDATLVPDEESDEPFRIPSPRERALESIEARMAGLLPAAEDGAPSGGEIALQEVVDAHQAYTEVRRGLDDPADLKRMLRGAGVLEFRIAVQSATARGDLEQLRQQLRESGPKAEDTPYAWFPLNDLESWGENAGDLKRIVADPQSYFAGYGDFVVEEYEGQYYMLLHDEDGMRLTRAEGDWSLTRAGRTVDEFGRPAISFDMDTRGADKLGKLTGDNVGRPMAILLDDEVYTAPNLRSRIARGGTIEGNFSPRELNYLIRTLSAGSLSAKLGEEPISENNIAPSLGKDNLRKGLSASWIALVAVGAFMLIYYFAHGMVAMLALLSNAVLILGAMSLARASFTLPGIAGIVLTFGMAVDANVLIYERIREELIAGNDLRTSVRLAFQKVLSTIVDANITNLIVCFVLAYTATEEVKGFAITLGIGVVATMFSSLVITRLLYVWLIDVFGIKGMPQLPLVVPFLQRALEPKVNWIKLRPLFLLVSAGFITLGISMIAIQQEEMFDTEFRGGTAVTLQMGREEQTGERLKLTRADVEQRIRDRIVAEVPEDNVLAELENADIVAVNPEVDGITSDQFMIKTIVGRDSVEDRNRLLEALTTAFAEEIDQQPELQFTLAEADAESAPAFAIYDGRLGENIRRPAITNRVDEYVNGVAIVLEDLRERRASADEVVRPTREDLERRIELTRNKPDFAEQALKRSFELIVLAGTDDAVRDAAVVVRDPGIDVLQDENAWRTELRDFEWSLVQTALTADTNLAGVQTFTAEVAQSFQAQAIVAVMLSFLLILIYIWVRFGSVRYSLAAIAALVHDVIIAIGLIALAEILYADGNTFFARIGLQPYKIDLALVAAVLTIVGYSLNDTIVILDRIRENRGKLAYASAEVVNRSISQTVSRTVITSGTTLVALTVLFLFGGDALSSFTYALICGVLIGTYSSIAVAAPLVFSSKIPPAARGYRRESEAPMTDDGDTAALPAAT